MDVVDKKLEELTVEEWGELFPIEMVRPQENWVSIFQEEKLLIEKTLTKTVVLDIQHMGSTSIPNLASKGSIDILVDIPATILFDEDIIQQMQNIGYEYCQQGGYGPVYMIFAKGFNREGKKEQQYYVHMTPKSHTELWDRIFFRDYLREHPEVAKNYENLKLDLVSKYSKDRRSFTKGKAAFVKEITELAKNGAIDTRN